MQRCTVVLVTSRHRKVRRTYTARTQCILLDTPKVKIILNSIAADMLWVRKVRYRYLMASLHTPHIRDIYSYRIAIFSSPEPKAHGELIVYRSIRRPCVRKHFQTQISPQPVGQL